MLIDHNNGSVVKKFEPFDSKKKAGITVARFIPGYDKLLGLLGSADGQAGLWSLDVENQAFDQSY